MQIQWWEGGAWSSAEAVLQSATRDSRRPEVGRMRNRIVSSVVEELGKDVRSEGRHRGTERVEVGLWEVIFSVGIDSGRITAYPEIQDDVGRQVEAD